MPDLSLEELLSILVSAEPDGAFDQAEKALREKSRDDLADALVKLQQDAGLEQDPTFDPNDLANPPGPTTALLWEAYEPLTLERALGLMREVDAALKQSAYNGLSLLPPEI